MPAKEIAHRKKRALPDPISPGASSAHIQRYMSGNTGRNDIGKLIALKTWVFTLWSTLVTELPILALVDGTFQLMDFATYLITQQEIAPNADPTNPHGGRHWQGYIELKDPLNLRQLQRALGWHVKDERNHYIIPHDLRPRVRSQQEEIEYCSKQATRDPNGRRIELGTRALPNAVDGRNMMQQHFMDGGSVIEALQNPHLFTQTLRNLNNCMKAQAMLDFAKNQGVLRDIHITLLFGPTGTGKSKYVHFRENGMAYKKPHPDWWDGYTNQQAICFDEWMPKPHDARFYSGSGYEIQAMNKFLDPYTELFQVKGAFVVPKYTRVYICTNVPPEKIYSDHPISVNSQGQTIDIRATFFRRIHDIIYVPHEGVYEFIKGTPTKIHHETVEKIREATNNYVHNFGTEGAGGGASAGSSRESSVESVPEEINVSRRKPVRRQRSESMPPEPGNRTVPTSPIAVSIKQEVKTQTREHIYVVDSDDEIEAF